MAAPASPLDHLVEELGLPGPAGAAFKAIIEDSFELKPRHELHHYTTAGGLRAILANPRQVWASLATHLNDSSELSHGREHILSEIKRLLPADGRLKEFQSDIDRLCRGDDWSEVFVTCFCNKPDLLSQWRGYGQYSLSLDPTKFATRHLLAGIKYEDQPDVTRFLKAMVDFFLKHLAPRVRSANRTLRDKIFATVSLGLSLAAATFKRQGFAEEMEFRIIALPPKRRGKILFRERERRIIPYIHVDLSATDGRLPLSTITVGPGVDFALEKRALQLLLDAKGYPRVKIEESAVSYRPN